MRALEWDALRVGDRVLVHDDLATVEDFPLCGGVVATVGGMTRPHGVGISVVTAPYAVTAIVRPLRMQVHRDPPDPSEPCWRCEWENRVMVDRETAPDHPSRSPASGPRLRVVR